MVLNFDMCMKFIPEFKGESGDGTALKNFLHCCDVMAGTAVNEDEKKTFVNILHAKATGKAYEVLEQNPNATWEALRVEFVKQFDSSESYESLLIEILNIKQHNTPTLEYANKVENLLLKLNSACAVLLSTTEASAYKKLNERIAKRGFEDGLKSGLRLMVKARAFDFLKDATNYAVEEDRQFMGNQNHNKSTPTNQNSFNFQRRHNSSNGNYSKGSNSTPPAMTAVKSEPTNSQIRSALFCKFCKKKGHLEEKCYQKHGRSGNESRQSTSRKEGSAGEIN